MELVRPGPDALARATALLDEGELIVLPTDTRYALAADALQEEAVERLFDALQRPADRPFTVCVGGFEDLGHVAVATPTARELVATKWPGPHAFVLRAKPWLPDALTARGETIAVRVPDAPFARQLAQHFGPLAIASLPAADAEAARVAAGAHARLLVDGGPTPGGRHAVIDATGGSPVVIRPAV